MVCSMRSRCSGVGRKPLGIPRIWAKREGAEDFRSQNSRSDPKNACATALGGAPAFPGRAEARRISAAVRPAWRSANWMAEGPPPEYPNTAARSMPSASRSSAYASAWPAGMAAGAGKIPGARTGKQRRTGDRRRCRSRRSRSSCRSPRTAGDSAASQGPRPTRCTRCPRTGDRARTGAHDRPAASWPH
jgi:hypothetical protein